MGIDLGGSGFRIGVFDTTTGALQGELERHQHASSTAPDAVLS
ncbi:MAG TPA: ROK family protein, partial [Candidatus Poseidoniales archaeon]